LFAREWILQDFLQKDSKFNFATLNLQEAIEKDEYIVQKQLNLLDRRFLIGVEDPS